MGGDQQFSDLLRTHFEELSKQIAGRQHRCVRGFLQALFSNLQPYALGLLELDMHRSNRAPKIRFPICADSRFALQGAQLGELVRIICAPFEGRPTSGFDYGTVCEIGAILPSPAQIGEIRQRLREADFKPRTRGGINFKSAKKPDTPRERLNGNVPFEMPVVLQRLWRTDGSPGEMGTGIWLYVINPCFTILPDVRLDKMTEVRRELSQLLALWSQRVDAVQHVLHAGLRLAGTKAETFAETIARRKSWIADNAVWPVNPVHFGGYLEQFSPSKTTESCSNDDFLACVKAVQDLAWALCNPQHGFDTPGCAECPGKSECPQHESQGLNKVTGIVAQLHFWHVAFSGNYVGADPAIFANRREALQALREASCLLDGTEEHPLDFSPEALARKHSAAFAGPTDAAHEEHERRRYERKLLRFFLARAIHESFAKFEHQWTAARPHRYILNYAASLARLATTLLADQPWTAPRIENLISVLAGYAHFILGVPPRLDLAMHLRQTLRGETALHTLKRRYRDHFFHTIEVCLIGHWFLLSRRAAGSRPMSEELAATCREQAAVAVDQAKNKELEKGRWHVPVTGRDMLANWWVAAIVHDTAYGIDVLQGTLQLLSFFQNHEGMRNFCRHTEEGVKNLAVALRPLAPELNEDMSLDKGDHGVIAAAHLDASLTRIGAVEKRRFLPAVRGISFHNTRVPVVDAARDPIAALLILCDTVQDWGRSQLGFVRSPAEVLSRLVEGSPEPADEHFGPAESFSFSMREVSPLCSQPASSPTAQWQPRSHLWNDVNKLEIVIHYAEWMTDRIDARDRVIFGWADTTYNLQRVDFSKWGFDLRVTHFTPYAPTWRLNDLRLADEERIATEFERFSAMAQEQSASFLNPWLECVASADPNAALGYKSDLSLPGKSCKWESLTFDLVRIGKLFLAETPLMAGQVGMVGAAISRWSHHIVGLAENQVEQQPPL
ncbi:MAG TPA: hypothetical protein VG734_17435 [Lacunisphaera sp.]|nr:hypothetical protein [Lacunisphaera sp.]